MTPYPNVVRKKNPNYEYGRWLSSPPPGDEVVISGMSGRLPESNNIYEFRAHLFNKEEMVTNNDRRGKLNHLDFPQKNAKLCSIDKYDAGYFGVHYRQADIMDPMMRLTMETAIEAIMDAGVNPRELEGTKTGVFISACLSDVEIETCCNITEPQSFAVTGYFRSFIAHRISYFLKLKGPTVIVDTACSSSLNALDLAFRSIRAGNCDNAIVGGVNLLLHPRVTHSFFCLGVLSRDGTCRPFDDNASGYVRGEAAVCIFLQKAKDSRRIYARIINAKCNVDGFKEHGMLFPSTEGQTTLIREIYNDSGINPSQLSFLEAHGTGTQIGDFEEAKSIDCALAQKRSQQLLIGSVKSNIGHSEAVSGLCSIIKMLLALETGLIPPNINFKTIKKGIKGLEEGRMKVVTEVTNLQEDAIVGVNNFGFGGNNGHAIFKQHKKTKLRREPQDDIPRLVCVSGRTEEAVQNMLNNVNKSLDEDYLALLYQLYKKPIGLFRGYTINKNGLLKTSHHRIVNPKPLHVFFGQLTENFKILGEELLQYTAFNTSISNINKILKQNNSKTFQEILKDDVLSNQKILGSICVQVALVDTLKALEIHPTSVFADSQANLVRTYYYGITTLQETISVAVKISHQNCDLRFPTKISEEKLPSDSLQKATVLNISDYDLNNKDLFLVDGKEVRFLETLGRLFQEGHNLQVYQLYPKVEFPVSRGTPMISPFVKWNHKKSWYTFKFNEFTETNVYQKEFSICYDKENNKFIAGHVIDGRNIFPAVGFLHLVWQTLAQNRRFLFNEDPVVFRNCRFIKAVTVPKAGYLSLLVTIQRGTGQFEILEKNTVVVTGCIQMCTDTSKEFTDLKSVEFEENTNRVMEKDEIYREIYLRGYNYSGDFKAIEKYNIDSRTALIKWEKNWVTFIDNLLQLEILSIDSRLLYIPIIIKKLVIDPAKHNKIAKKIGNENILLPAYNNKACKIIKSGGVEISGVQTRSISKRKPRLLPVLEKNVFVSNINTLEIQEAVRVNTQIILENSLESHFKAVEVVDEYTSGELLLPLVCQALDDVPVVTPNLTISTKSKIKDILGVKTEVVNFTPESNILLLIGTKLLERLSSLNQMLVAVKKNGFMLSREDVNFVAKISPDVEILTEFQIMNEKLVLFRKSQQLDPPKFIPVSSSNFQWLPQLQSSLTKDENIVLYAKNKEPEGLLGLVNCIRREPNCSKVRCVFVMDDTSNLAPDSCLLSEQLKKNFAINVFKENTWGTYRHLLLEPLQEVESEHYYGNTTNRGEISSLKWLQRPLTVDNSLGDDELIMVYYNSINFRDVMIVSGRVTLETITTNRIQQECLIGLEFCGKTLDGRRVAGCLASGALSSIIHCKRNTLWEIPPEYTFEEAATITVVYYTVFYAFFMVGDLKPRSSILIHSGTGGVGLAAINVCLYYNCEIFVTVGTREKREYLRKHYPQIPESHIGNSRDTSFEEMVKTQTKSRGVDFVLNSLADDKLKASVRCLAPGGCFLEIGKYDLGNDTELELLLMEKRASFHGVMIDHITWNCHPAISAIMKKIQTGLKAGYVKPLPRTVFEREELESSFRYMMTGKHIGKVLIKLRDEKKEVVCPHKAIPMYYCNSHCSYIIIGGLGGIGLELADWLILRGARKLVLVSRTGLPTGYQIYRNKFWSSYGVQVYISTKDVTTKQGCTELIKEAQKLGSVDGIFNLAVVLKDALFEDQNEETFAASSAPKAQATIFLDQVTRELCPELRSFVVFSSVSCGRGNIGQTNYGMANSVMERICEKRKNDGLAALAIQWGAVGEVGLVAKMQKENKELVIGGTLQQKISSCFETLDKFLNQKHPVVSSMVVAQKHNRSCGVASAVDSVAEILGFQSLKTISQHATLAELGMDSMTTTEIIQMLEKEFEIYLSPNDMRSLTFAKLTKLEAEKYVTTEEKKSKNALHGLNLLMKTMPNKNTSHSNLISLKININKPNILLFPGLDGAFHNFEDFVKEVEGNINGVQYKYTDPEDNIAEVAQNLIPHIENILSKECPNFFIGYSYGADVALEVVKILENCGYTIEVILIDGSPTYLTSLAIENLPQSADNELETAVLIMIFNFFVPIKLLLEYKNKFLNCASLEERIDLGWTLISEDFNKSKLESQRFITTYKRIKSLRNYSFGDEKIKSKVYLIKAQFPIIKDEDDYQLAKICKNLVRVSTVKGDHATMLNQLELSRIVNEILSDVMIN